MRMIIKSALVLSLLAVANTSPQNAKAQSAGTKSAVRPAFEKGSKTLGVGAGVGISYGYSYSDYVQLPAVFVTYDQGIINDVGPGTIGVGGVLAVKSAYYNYSFDNDRVTWRNYMLGGRGTYHLTILKDKNNKFDPYGGVTAGFRISRYEDEQLGASETDLVTFMGFFVGAKYNFKKNFGVFSELGYDISILRVGVNFNF